MFVHQVSGDIAGGAAKEIGQYQHTGTLVQFGTGLACCFKHHLRFAISLYRDCFYPERTIAQDSGCRIEHVLSELTMRDE